MTGVPELTKREFQVLLGMANGKSNGEIGREMLLSEDTVKTHARTLYRKLVVRDRAHAVAVGYQLGLLGGARSAASPGAADLERRVRAVLDSFAVQFTSPSAEFQRGYRTCEMKVRSLLGAEVPR